MNLKEEEITQQLLKELFYYNPITGVFIRRKCTANRHKLNETVGTINNQGYVVFSVGGKVRLAHRMAWIYMFGSISKETIDHINGNRDDNRISNLREASRKENQHNRKATKRNKLGIKGISKVGDLYKACIYHNGKNVYIGTYSDLNKAIEEYRKKEFELRGLFSNQQGAI